MKLFTLVAGAMFAVVAVSQLQAEDPVSSVVVSGLDNPTGVAVQPGSGHVFIAARDGVHRLVPGTPGKVYPEIVGYPTDIYGKGPKHNIGPLGLAFMGSQHLVVGDGSRPDASELVRVYQVGSSPLSEGVPESKPAYTLGPIGPGEASEKGEGNFYAVAVTEDAIYVTANGDDSKGWVLSAPVAESKPGELGGYLATKPAVNVDAPVAITTDQQGHLVIGQMGEMTVPNDSLLTFYEPKSKKLVSSYKTGLSDIAGLAYSTKTGKLYAVDYSWSDLSQGGLFELTVQGDQCQATKILSLMKPTSLAFDAQGNCYVTVFGEGEDNTSQGQLIMVKGL